MQTKEGMNVKEKMRRQKSVHFPDNPVIDISESSLSDSDYQVFTNRRRSKSQIKLANMVQVNRKDDSSPAEEAEESKERSSPTHAELDDQNNIVDNEAENKAE